MVKVEVNKNERVCQGDIFKNIEYIEYALEKDGLFEISKINFPLVMVLTQDCDLQQDFSNRSAQKADQDKYLISVIVAPLYNVEHVYSGDHLSELSLKMQSINRKKTPGDNLIKNQNPRYHYLEFDKDISIPQSVIDFKHYFTINVEVLSRLKPGNFVCKVAPLYRENISHRFAGFLSRIGLPDLAE